MKTIIPTNIRYIKLGAGGRWETAAFDEGHLEWGLPTDPHDLALAGDWSAMKEVYTALYPARGTATGYTNEARAFYDGDPDTLWITFARGRMWWAQAAPEVHLRGGEGADAGIRSVATYDADEKERRRQKVGFFMGDARIKATTLHSFKGWEAPLLVIHVGQAKGKDSLALIYTGLTRLKQSSAGSRLTVVSSSAELLDYAMTWRNFVHWRATDAEFATALNRPDAGGQRTGP
ncbi:hypothetical protein [Sphingomonas sp. TZW2008]|uniref:hypothetical protein n=1 Tax=Sphingomonas sp. TZW2008 TaxID=1917973 RepID=UPI000A26F6D0|nr:hypothetical protein [Sphingomonas sp. TZW2008]